jgi:hypothetical protein
MTKATLNQLLRFPCPHCQYARHVSVEDKRATVILPRICPTKPACEREVLRAYYLTMGEPKC